MIKAADISNARDLLEFIRENEARLQVRVSVGGAWETKMLNAITPEQWASWMYRFISEWLRESKVPGAGNFVHKKTGDPVPSIEPWSKERKLFT